MVASWDDLWVARKGSKNRRHARPGSPGSAPPSAFVRQAPGAEDGRAARPGWGPDQTLAAAGDRATEGSLVVESDPTDAVGFLWSTTRSGARSGRGYHYQDVVGAWMCGRILSGDLAVELIVPESLEDLSCEGQTTWHVQVKSRQERVGDFSPSEVAGHLLDLAKRHRRRQDAGLQGQSVLVLERPVAGYVPTVWGQSVATLPVEHAVRRALRAAGGRRGLTDEEIESVCRTTSVFVLPWRVAAEQTRDAVAARHHGLLPDIDEPPAEPDSDLPTSQAGEAAPDPAGLAAPDQAVPRQPDATTADGAMPPAGSSPGVSNVKPFGRPPAAPPLDGTVYAIDDAADEIVDAPRIQPVSPTVPRRQPTGIDWGHLTETAQRHGRRGEEWAYLQERLRLQRSGQNPDLVKWISRIDELANHDLTSIDEDGETIYIEVKSNRQRRPSHPVRDHQQRTRHGLRLPKALLRVPRPRREFANAPHPPVPGSGWSPRTRTRAAPDDACPHLSGHKGRHVAAGQSVRAAADAVGVPRDASVASGWEAARSSLSAATENLLNDR